jgi:hypothetical protein
MLPKLSLAAAFLAVGLLSPQAASSASLPQINAPDASTLVQQVAHRRHVRRLHRHHRHVRYHRHRHIHLNYSSGRCHRWRRICADRYGWHTRAYYRCVRRHAC